jgi:hypothetical protein
LFVKYGAGFTDFILLVVWLCHFIIFLPLFTFSFLPLFRLLLAVVLFLFWILRTIFECIFIFSGGGSVLFLGSLFGFIFCFLFSFFVVVLVCFFGSPTALKCLSVEGFKEKWKRIEKPFK